MLLFHFDWPNGTARAGLGSGLCRFMRWGAKEGSVLIGANFQGVKMRLRLYWCLIEKE